MSAEKPRPHIVDEEEFRTWYAEGRSYAWMVKEYEHKYAMTISPSLLGNARRRLGLAVRPVAYDADLLPWRIAPAHAYHPVAVRLRQVHLHRHHPQDLPAAQAAQMQEWVAGLATVGVVVHYTREKGFTLLPPRAGVDTGLIRVPEPGELEEQDR